MTDAKTRAVAVLEEFGAGCQWLEDRIAAAISEAVEEERERIARHIETQVDLDGDTLTNAKAFAATIRGMR